MHLWQLASGAFFLYVALVALLRRPRRQSVKAVAGAAAGLLVVLASLAIDTPILAGWIWPPALLLIAYWSSGPLFVAPRSGHEAALRWLDDQLRVRDLATRTPRAIAEVLEAAYVGVYPLVLLALLLYLQFSPSPDSDRFWSVVLVTDFLCFAVLPWVQTRPPRALECGEPWQSSVRQFNLRLLGATSIQVNTFPSGHAAEGLAAFLLALAAPPGLVVAMLLAAVAVSAGAVLGRYHYLADALAGWVVAVGVFLALS
jgi:membrane-associated phospholipid phosphatase